MTKLTRSDRTVLSCPPYRESSHIVRPMAQQFARPILPATAMHEVAFLQVCSPLWQRAPRKSCRRALPTRGSGTVDLCSFSMALASMPDTPENQAVYRQPPIQQPGLGFPLARTGVHRWQPALATTWPLRRTKARAPAKRISSDECTRPSNPEMCFLPTPYSTITSSPANCAGVISTSLLTLSMSAREVG